MSHQQHNRFTDLPPAHLAPSSADLDKSYISAFTVPGFDPEEVQPHNLTYYQYGLSAYSRELVVPEGAQTGTCDIYSVNGRPDLLVRSNEGEGVTASNMEVVASSIEAARQIGVPVIPFELVPFGPHFSGIVVPRLSGVSLLDALRDDPSLSGMADSIWLSNALYLADRWQQRKPFVVDTTLPGQYMYANMPDSTEKHIWEVDVPTHRYSANDPLSLDYYYEELATIAHGIVDVEVASASDLSQSRLALGELLQHAQASATTVPHRGVLHAAEEMLKHKIILPHELEDF